MGLSCVCLLAGECDPLIIGYGMLDLVKFPNAFPEYAVFENSTVSFAAPAWPVDLACRVSIFVALTMCGRSTQ